MQKSIVISTERERFTINGDQNKYIEFNPSDPNIVTRFEEASKTIKKAQTQFENITESNVLDAIRALDNLIRQQIDYIFDYPVSEVVFGNTSSFSTCNGIPYYERFLNAIMPIIENAVKKEGQKSKARISKYTEKYTK